MWSTVSNWNLNPDDEKRIRQHAYDIIIDIMQKGKINVEMLPVVMVDEYGIFNFDYPNMNTRDTMRLVSFTILAFNMYLFNITRDDVARYVDNKIKEVKK